MNAAFKPSLPVLKCMHLHAVRPEPSLGVDYRFESLTLEDIGEDAPNGACWSANIVSFSAKGKKKSKRVLVSKKYHMDMVKSEYHCDGTGTASIWYDARILSSDEVVKNMLVTELLKRAETYLNQSKAHVASLQMLKRGALGEGGKNGS